MQKPLVFIAGLAVLAACSGQVNRAAPGGGSGGVEAPIADGSSSEVGDALPPADPMDATPVDVPGASHDVSTLDAPQAEASDASSLMDSGLTDADAVSSTFDAGVKRGCVAMPTPPDPTAGWMELADPYPPPPGQEYPNLEYPYNLAPQDDCVTTVPITSRTSPCRFSRKGALSTFWIFQDDLTHFPPDAGVAPTSPRSEMHWSTFKASDARAQRMWAGDVRLRGADAGALPESNCILQVHTNATGQGPVYLRITGGKLTQLGGPTYFSPQAGVWFNMKVAFDAKSLRSTVYVNDCPVGTWDGSSFVGGALPGGDIFYFKNGSYGCSSGECIVDFANVRFLQK